MSSDKKLAAFAAYMSQFATHRGADMKWVMEASSHGRCFSHAWDEATKAEREACAKVAELVAREIDDTNGTASYIVAAIIARGEK